MGQAKSSQMAALKAAQRAYAAALQLESHMVSESAEIWLAASEAASEKVQEAFTEASGPSNAEVGHVVTAVRVAHLLSEVRHSYAPTAGRSELFLLLCKHTHGRMLYQSCNAAHGLILAGQFC